MKKDVCEVTSGSGANAREPKNLLLLRANREQQKGEGLQGDSAKSADVCSRSCRNSLEIAKIERWFRRKAGRATKRSTSTGLFLDEAYI